MRRGPVTPARSSTRSVAASGPRSRSSRRRSPRSTSSDLNAFAFLDASARSRRGARRRRRRSRSAACPAGIKELEPVTGWPATEASLVFRDRDRARHTSTVARACSTAAARSPVGLTTASEFGGLNVERHQAQRRHAQPVAPRADRRRLVGRQRRRRSRAASSRLATGGDGGGSIRIPAGYTGLLGMKGTFGRIPRGPARLLPARTPSCSATSPARCATRRATTTCARATTRATRPACRSPAAGRPGSARTTSRAGASRSSPRSAA